MKIIAAIQLNQAENSEEENIGKKIAMHVAASSPIAITKEDIKAEDVINKELDIIKAELVNLKK